MKKILIGCFVFISGFIVVPFNSISHYETPKGVITKIVRKSVFDGGVYFTLGSYDNLFALPNSYLKPEIIDSGFDSYFELLADLTGENIIFYAWGSHVEVKGDHLKKQFFRPTSFKQWTQMKLDSTGKYLLFH